MNLTLPEKEKVSKRRISVYIISLIICILAVIIAVGVQILGNDVIDNMFGINKIVKRTEQEEAELKANFETIFDNKTEDKGNYTIQKIEANKEIVYNNYQKEEKNENYELNVNLPYINIRNKDIEDFNKEITNTFKAKAEEILNNTESNSIYTVKYKAYAENNILSVVIYSDLKQDTSAQRVIVQTFNFDLEKNKKLSLEDLTEMYDISKNEIQNKINTDIKEEQRKSEDLKELGYNLFSRDLNNTMYKVENISEYFVYDNNIYIIFAYGNNQITSEMDLVII